MFDEHPDVNACSLINHVIKEMTGWINHNYTDDINVVSVTQRSGYSHWYFQKKFQEVVGITLAQYIRHVRVQKSIQQIILTDMKIMDIALGNGFNNQQVFTRIFKKTVKFTPGQIRRRFHGKPEWCDYFNRVLLNDSENSPSLKKAVGELLQTPGTAPV